MKTRTVFITCFFALVLALHAQENDGTFPTTEISAEFPGGAEAMSIFIQESLKYPTRALKDKVEGQCIVEAVIDTCGNAIQTRIIKSLTPDCDKEAIRVVKELPQWKPAIQFIVSEDDKKIAKKVPSKCAIPVNFKLPNE